MKSSSARVLTVAVVALAALLSACGDDSKEPAATQPAVTAADLEGRTFISSSTTGITLVEGSQVRMSFDDGNLGVNAGCNNMGGGYTIEENVLVVGQMMSTMMACEQPLMDQDTAIAAFLAAKPTLVLSGDQLVLATADASMTLMAEADTPLEGTTWEVTTVIANEAASGVPTGGQATLTIVDGQAQVSAGCNTGNAEVTVTADTITFGPMALTKKMCEPEFMELETAVITVLIGEVTYDIDGASLTLTNGDVGLGLTAQS